MSDAQPARRPAMSRASRRELILDTAEDLFYKRGIHAVGMDELVDATGLSKMSVYRVFATKDELVGAYLHRRAERLLALIDADIQQRVDAPADALRAVLAAVVQDTTRSEFRGCPFNNASAEFADDSHPASVEARQYKTALLSRLERAAVALDPVGGVRLARQLHLIFDGMYLSAGILGAHGPVTEGREMAERLIRAAESA